MRIGVEYFDAYCDPRVAVPPDSIWVTYATSSGNLLVNDETTQVFADDSTDGCGFARVTIPSLSGCGVLSVYLYVAGVFQGSRAVVVRTTDTNADGRTRSGDATSPCDLNYDGAVNSGDVALVDAHRDHWRRNALHGTLVRRTNYCETCPDGAAGTKGGSLVYWSPSGRYISHTQFVQAPPPATNVSCKVFIVPSDPKEGNALTQFTFAPYSDHDYDPSWSPRNDYIVFDRRDKTVIRKKVPWSGDPSEVALTTSSDCPAAGDNIPVVSPNGEWVVFSRCNPFPPGGWSLWKIRIDGGTPIQLTPTVAGTNFYASWSPDGQTIFFQRQDFGTYGDERWTLWKVPAAGGTGQEVFVPPGSPLSDAVQPALSPDDSILVMGFGKRDFLVRNVITNTLDPTLASPGAQKLVPNYPDTNFAEKGDFPLLSPRLSPDGTRTTLGSKQVWATRRNMNLPPRFISVTSRGEGTRSVADTTATMDFAFSCRVGTFNTITVSAVDPEADLLTYHADFLPPGFGWDSATRTLTFISHSVCPLGQTFYVRFRVTTASGGTDALIATIRFPDLIGGLIGAGPHLAGEESAGEFEAPTVAAGALAVRAPNLADAPVRLIIFDLAGRRVATVGGRAGERLVWDLTDERGHAVPTGVYLYRWEAGGRRQDGKFVVIR